MSVKFSNNGKTTLSAGISASDTSVPVTDASVFPTITGSEYFYMSLEDTSGDIEIVKVTGVSSNTLTVTRAQESTTAQAFASGDKAENRLTAGGLNDVATQADTDTDTTYTAGSGLSLTGTEFANTAPDQTVALTGAGATSISGTYPNFTITSTDNNTTYSVGDGGLTQNNFTDALKTKLDGVATNANNYTLPFTDNSSNWDTAYGWGNHASAGYLTSFDITTQTDPKYLRSDASDSFTGTLTGGALHAGGEITNSSAKLQVNGFQRTGTIYLHEGTSAVAGNNWALETTSGGELRWNTNKLWHAGNDGTGSGLDADTVDGIQASSFLQLSGGTMAGTLNFNNNNITNVNHLTFNDSGANEGLQWLGGSDWRIFESPDNLTNAAGNLQFVTGSTRRFGITTSGYIGATRIYSAVDRSSGFFYNDSGLRTAYSSGDFYVQSSVGNYYNYATNIYLGNTSGDTVRFRGNVVNHNGFSFDAEGDFSTTRDIVSTARNRGVFGTYHSYYTDQIWSMGTAYRNHSSGTNFGNLYGLAYKHTNNSTGGTMGGSHQMVWCQNGSPKCSLGTNIWTSGNVTAYSDIRVKTNIEHIPNALDKVCQLNGYTFDRTDVTFDEHGEAETPVRQTGVIAQEVLEVLPEAVLGDEEGHYSVAYGNMVGLLIESIKELKAEVDDLKAQLEAK